MTAVNTVSTVSTTRADVGADTVLTGFLKDVYLQGVHETVYMDNAFTRLIQGRVGDMSADGRRFVGSWSTQWAAGVGAIAEGGDFRPNVPIDGDQGYEFIKYMNTYFSLTGPAMKTVNAGQGSFVDIVAQSLQTQVKAAKMNTERIITGAGDGVIAKVVSVAAGSNTITVEGQAYFDTQYVLRGSKIEVHTAGSFGTLRTYDGSLSEMTVSATTKGLKTTGVNGTIVVSEDIDGSSTIAAGDYITLSKTYTSTTCLEMNGLQNLISDGSTNTGDFRGAESGNNFKYCWPWNSSGKDRTAALYEYFLSHVEDIAGELDEENLLDALTENIYQFQGDPDMLVVTPKALNRYFNNSKDDRRFNTMDALEWTGGYTGLGIQLGERKLMLTALGSMPAGYGFIIDTKEFAFVRPPGMSGYEWVTNENGSILRQKEGSDEKFASSVDYTQFICFQPGRQTKLHDITES